MMSLIFRRYIVFASMFLTLANPSICWGADFFERLYSDVLKDGNQQEIQAYSFFKSPYDSIATILEAGDRKELLSEINKHVNNKEMAELARTSMMMSKFLGYFLFLKGSALVFDDKNDDAIDLIYLSFSKVYEVNSRFSIRGFNSLGFVSGGVLSTWLSDQRKELLDKNLRSKVFEIPYIERIPSDNVCKSEKNGDLLIGEIIRGINEDKFSDYYDILVASLKHYNLLKPIASALLINYNPDNAQAVSLLSDIDKKAGFKIPRKVDKGYGFLKMGVYYDEALVKKLTEKYLLVSWGGR